MGLRRNGSPKRPVIRFQGNYRQEVKRVLKEVRAVEVKQEGKGWPRKMFFF